VRKQHVLNDLEAAGVPVETFSDGLCRVQLSVDGLHCAACSWLIEKMRGTVPGLKSARARMSDGTLDMVYDPQVTSPANVAERLGRLGYVLSPIDSHDDCESADRMLQRDHWIGNGSVFLSTPEKPIFIPGNQLESIVRLVDASKSAVRGIRACFAASLLYNTITISLAISGWIHPLIAALFMPLSGITVLTMALLVRTFKTGTHPSQQDA
jgi:cation transport ATPase